MNPLLILIASLLRHTVVTGLSWLILMFRLPAEVREQVEGAADFVTTSLISLLVWAVVKYGKPLLQKWGILASLAVFVALSFPSCSYVDQVVDTRGAKVTKPDEDGDGLPDEIVTSSDKVKPKLNEKGVNELNEGLTKVIINYTK